MVFHFLFLFFFKPSFFRLNFNQPSLYYSFTFCIKGVQTNSPQLTIAGHYLMHFNIPLMSITQLQDPCVPELHFKSEPLCIIYIKTWILCNEKLHLIFDWWLKSHHYLGKWAMKHCQLYCVQIIIPLHILLHYKDLNIIPRSTLVSNVNWEVLQ